MSLIVHEYKIELGNKNIKQSNVASNLKWN